MRIFVLIVVLFALKARASGFGPYESSQKSAWDSANHPAILVKNPETHFPSLPLSATLENERTLWSDSYWPRNAGGIARRWQDISGNIKYKILSEKQARALTPEEIAKLSPAEKFDLLQDDYSFSFTSKVKRQNPLNRPDWEGICHGWTQASVHHEQFSPMTLKNKSGKEIRFASSDVAALISYYYARVGGGKVRFLGRRCWENAGNTGIKCTDMNAGAFHVVLTNRLRERKSFIMDLDPYKHVWNFPVLGYETRVLEEHAPQPGSAKGTVKEILVSTKLFYSQETGAEWNPPLRVPGHKDYWYYLELDSSEKIIGGSWSDANHPDFAWASEPVKIPSPYSVFITQ
ncbi:MAG: hypothetical protein V4598_12395 [Bdellovibrionota bacterium]